MLADYCIERSQMNYGLTYSQARELAYKYTVALNLNDRISQKWHVNQSADEEWLYEKKFQFILVLSWEYKFILLNTSFNEHNVKTFFDNLEELLKK